MLRALKRMLLRVAFETLEPFNEVLFLIVWQPLHNINHEDSIAAVAKSWAEVKPLILGVVDDLWLSPPIDIVVEKDALLKQHVHLIVFRVVAGPSPRLLENVQIKHLAEISYIDLVDLDWVARFFLREKVSIAVLELVDQNLVALHIDSAEDAVIRNPHHYHLILEVALILLLQSDAFGCELGLGIVGALLLCMPAVPLPERATVEARAWMLLVYMMINEHDDCEQMGSEARRKLQQFAEEVEIFEMTYTLDLCLQRGT